MQHNEILELDISGLTHDGRGLGRTEQGLVIFVQGALPGQKVRLQVDEVKKNLVTAKVLEVLRPAPQERAAPCAHAAECGGCAWQNLPYAAQLDWKRKLLMDSLTRIGKLPLTLEQIPPILPSPAGEFFFRNKMEFAFGLNAQGEPDLGLRQKASHTIVPVRSCLLQSERAMRVVEQARIGLTSLPQGLFEHLHYLVVREPDYLRATQDAQCLVEVIGTSRDSQLLQLITELGEQLLATGLASGFMHSHCFAAPTAAYGDKILLKLGQTRLREALPLYGQEAEHLFNLGVGAFFQVNTQAAALLYTQALGFVDKWLPRDQRAEAWDLYCGVGGLSLGLANLFTQVQGLDSEARAVALARQNSAPQTNLSFEVHDVDRLATLLRNQPAPNLISLDPPRSGLSQTALQAILRAKPAYILYISCDPGTLSRDLQRLATAYQVLDLQGVDLFPQSPHLECVVLLGARSA